MRSKTGFILAGLLALLTGGGVATTAAADDLAVIVSNTDYRRMADVRSDIAASELSETLDDRGFEVLVLSNGTTDRMHARFTERLEQLDDADRLFILLVGHVVTDGYDSWLLGTEAREPNLIDVGAQGLRITSLMPILTGREGRAGLFVAPAPGTTDLGPGLTPGYLPAEIPDDVAVVEGPEAELIDLIVEDVLKGRVPLNRALEARAGRVIGYGLGAPRSDDAFDPDDAETAEAEAWDTALAENTVEGYRNYLVRFPRGENRVEAVRRLSFLRLGPEARAEARERDLDLDREARREIQRNLSILGYDTRGVDGIFGPGTRAAVRRWQGDEGFEATGYLSGNQVTRLQEAAALRQEALEAEARERQEEADRADAAYWRETGRGESEAGLRDYLSRYPDGLFSGLARGRLDELEASRRSSAQAADRDAWEAAVATGTEDAYRRYLRSYPEGAFADEARTRILALRSDQGDDAAVEAARREENDVLANPITRLLVERRLAQLGLEPGEADGQFDEDTRRAIRRYQRTRELTVTGYVTQATLVRMLAGN